VLAYGEACGSAPRASATSSWGYLKNLVYSVPIDTIEILSVLIKNAATTIRNNRGMLEKVEESFRRRFHYCIYNSGGHLNTSCND
jgi:hypothetical protein